MRQIEQTIHKIKKQRESILLKYQETPLFQRSLKDVRRVVIINSSSRSGSSLLYAILRKLPQVYSLSGEAAPFYKLNTLFDGFNLFESDKIPGNLADKVMDYDGLSRDFFSDLYKSGNGILTNDIDIDDYSEHLVLRFLLQWVEIDFDISVLKSIVQKAFGRFAKRFKKFNLEDFYLILLEEICAVYPKVDPFYYDLSAEKVALHFPFLDIPSGPPNEYFNIEEPPFILLSPGIKADTDDLENKILLLKSTVDGYRMNIIEKIFPCADIRIIHLVRNPAATTNGIYDGWLHRGFFSHNLQPYFNGDIELKKLSIKGYSDIFPHGNYWWNFDLPEGWQNYADKDLIEVCAFQWYSANAEILKYLSGSKTKSCMFRYEDIIRNISSRTEEFRKMLDFAGIPESEIYELHLDDLPVIQSTLPPQLYRWKKRKDIIMRLMIDPKILEISSQLGYLKENMEEWL